jgi:hypothetical protein
MSKFTPADKARFHAFVVDAARSAENIEFVLGDLGAWVKMDYSIESLVRAEAVYWDLVEGVINTTLTDEDHFAQLLGQYMGSCVTHHTGARWIQSEEKNPMFGQPCVDGFGNKPWERIYPVHTSLHLRELPTKKPDFPGARERRVFAAHLEKALSVFNRGKSDP